MDQLVKNHIIGTLIKTKPLCRVAENLCWTKISLATLCSQLFFSTVLGLGSRNSVMCKTLKKLNHAR